MQKHRSLKGPSRTESIRHGRMAPSEFEDAGYTLIELMIALMIFAFGILAIWSMQGTAIRGNTKARRITEGAALASNQVETLMRLPYLNDPTDPTSAPNELIPGTHSRTEDSYTVQWEVSTADYPINNVKTIEVTALWTEAGQQRSVSYVYYKANLF